MTKRVTVYLPDPIYDWLEEWAISEQRPVSNLAAFLLERSIREVKERQATLLIEQGLKDAENAGKI